MTELTTIDETKLPAHIRLKSEDVAADLVAGASVGITVMSIKGRQFTVVRGDERTTIMSPKDPDAPASYIDVVILRANRAVSKMYFAQRYEEGISAAPDCFSLDGERPDPSVHEPQAKSCKTCPHNQWGSRVTDSGKLAKACADHRRIAIAPADALEDVMLLRVPPKSLKALAEYGRTLAARKIDYRHVITRIKFVKDVATPQLEFKAVGFLDKDQAAEVDALYDDERVLVVIGQPGQALDADLQVPTEKPVEEKVDDGEDEEEPLVTTKTTKKAKEKPAKKAKKAAPAKEAEPEKSKEDDTGLPMVDDDEVAAQLAALFGEDD